MNRKASASFSIREKWEDSKNNNTMRYLYPSLLPPAPPPSRKYVKSL